MLGGSGTGLESANSGRKFSSFPWTANAGNPVVIDSSPGMSKADRKAVSACSEGPLAALPAGHIILLGGVGMILPDHARFGRLSLGFLLALLVVVLSGVQAGTNDRQAETLADRFWRPGVPVAVAVRDGQARFRVPVSGAGSEVLVIVSALAYSPGPYPIRLDAAAATDAGLPDQAAASTSRPPRLRSFTPGPIPQPVSGLPALKRDFSLMVRDGDVASASNYLAVRGVLRAVGKRVQVYVASEDVGQGRSGAAQGPGRDIRRPDLSRSPRPRSGWLVMWTATDDSRCCFRAG